MDDCEVDRRALKSACRALGVDPDGPHAPDLDSIADRDEPLKAKCERVREHINGATDADRPGR